MPPLLTGPEERTIDLRSERDHLEAKGSDAAFIDDGLGEPGFATIAGARQHVYQIPRLPQSTLSIQGDVEPTDSW